jgi:hypothetical protein
MSSDNPSVNVTDNPLIERMDTAEESVAPSILSRPDLKRTLKDLLVQDEVSDSDMEMLERHSLYDEKFDQNEDSVDPDMCVECGDQVQILSLSG